MRGRLVMEKCFVPFKTFTNLTRLALLVGGSAMLPTLAQAAPTVTPLTFHNTNFPMTGAPYLAAYRWGAANKTGGAKANEAFAKWLNRPVVWAEDFEPTEQWDNNIEGGGWQLGEWSDWKKAVKGRRFVLSVPLLPGGWDRSGAKGGSGAGEKVSYEAGARGDYNDHFKHLAENLVIAVPIGVFHTVQTSLGRPAQAVAG